MVDESTKQALEQMMAKFSQDVSTLQQKKQVERSETTEFDKTFESLKHEVIWPAFIEIGNLINSYGHDYHISEEKEFVDATARYIPPSITFNIFPAGMASANYTPDSTPYIQFAADRYAKKINIMVSTMMPGEGGVIGSHGQHDPAEITREFVEKEIVTVLQNTPIFHKDKE